MSSMLTPGRILAAVLALLAAGGLWYGYDHLTLIRGTWFWDLRYVVFAVLAFLFLSLMDATTAFLRKVIGSSE